MNEQASDVQDTNDCCYIPIIHLKFSSVSHMAFNLQNYLRNL